MFATVLVTGREIHATRVSSRHVKTGALPTKQTANAIAHLGIRAFSVKRVRSRAHVARLISIRVRASVRLANSGVVPRATRVHTRAITLVH